MKEMLKVNISEKQMLKGNINIAGGGIINESDPTVPAHVKAIKQEDIDKWNNGTGDVDLTDYAKKSEVPTKTSQLTNDSSFINSIKTINGNSLIGEGNIIIEGGSGGGTSNVVVSPTEPLTGEDVWFQKSRNLFDKETVIQGKHLKQDGSYEINSNWYVSDYIVVKPNEQYTYSGYTFIPNTANGGVYNAYYDADKNLVNTFLRNAKTGTLTIPSNVSYVRFSIYKYSDIELNDVDIFQFEKGSIVNDYQEYAEDKIYTKTNNGYEEFSVKRETNSNEAYTDIFFIPITLSIPNATFYKIIYETKKGSCFESSGEILTCTKPGKYLVLLNTIFNTNDSGGRYHDIMCNGRGYGLSTTAGISGLRSCLSSFAILELSEGDTLFARAYQTTGSNLDLISGTSGGSKSFVKLDS